MADIIASRAAAFRLSWIIVILMMPILFLGYFMINTLQQEAALVQRESRGAELINLLAPVYINAAADNSIFEDNAALMLKGPDLAKSLVLSAAFANLGDALNSSHPNASAVMANAGELIRLTVANAGIILDARSETYHLAETTGVSLPLLISDFKNLQNTVRRAAANNQKSTEGLAEMLLSVGRLGASSSRVADDIVAAAENSSDSMAFLKTIRLSAGIKTRIAGFTTDIRKSFLHPEDMAPATFFATVQMADPVIDEYKALWNDVNAKFTTLLAIRQTQLSQKMSKLTLVSFASLVVGLGLAITMFQSTLKRLDDVQDAKVEADIARDEAEDMAEKLSRINDDMVRVNQELGSNMQMLKDAQDALVKKGRMEQMGQLTATIAHELRNPLGAVRTSAFLIERKIKDRGLGVESQLQRINNGINRCDNIITQLLDFSRTKQLSPQKADLDMWIAKTIEEEARQLPAVVTVECRLALDGLEVPFDPARLQRAIINLISNASEAMVGHGDDPKKFTVADPRIVISTRMAGDRVEVAVADNGPGIPPENLLKIREPLFTTKSFGTGLGLPAVEQIASQHGGTLDITSTLGQGSTFTLRLPRAVAIAGVAA